MSGNHKGLPETLAEFTLAIILVALWLAFTHFDFLGGRGGGAVGDLYSGVEDVSIPLECDIASLGDTTLYPINH